MELNNVELAAMDNSLKKFIHENIELRVFKFLGLDGTNKDILELGCGSGFGAELLSEMEPKSYLGVDVMAVQLEKARSLNLKNSEFVYMDASNLNEIDSNSKDVVVIFRILHHVPEWRIALKECFRVLKPKGKIFVVEPYKPLIKLSDKFLKWKHPEEALFTVKEFVDGMQNAGFTTKQVPLLLGFAVVGEKNI